MILYLVLRTGQIGVELDDETGSQDIVVGVRDDLRLRPHSTQCDTGQYLQ